MKVEEAVLGSPSLKVLMVCVDVNKKNERTNDNLHSSGPAGLIPLAFVSSLLESLMLTKLNQTKKF